MVSLPSSLALLLALATAGAATAGSPPAADPPPAGAGAHAAADSAPAHRVVRRFPPIEVRAPLHDLRSSQTVHGVPGAALRALPVDGLREAIALQPGVVAEGEELHVRGGRAGETVEYLDGLCLSEPLRGRGMEVPVGALAGAELVSGAPDARYGCGLAGVLDLRSAAPAAHPALAWRWGTDGGLDTRYDRGQARLATPLGVGGLGVLAAADATFDDTALPALRSRSRHDRLGLRVGWRAENRLLGFARLAPLGDPGRFSAEVLTSREVSAPYDPMWSLDGWVLPPPNDKITPTFSPVPLPGYVRYRAADHLAMTDERRLATLSVRAGAGPRHGTLALGWLRTRTVTGIGGAHPTEAVARFEDQTWLDPFHVLWGDDPIHRTSGSDVLSLRAELENAAPSAQLRSGIVLTHEDVSLREVETLWPGWFVEPGPSQTDPLRDYHVQAPGASAWAQVRWTTGGMILNTGLRAEAWTPGRAAERQTLPGSADWVLMLSPRLGLAYPISIRDVFSLAYQRVQQAPGRDYLYDRRVVVGNHRPLGNPALRPASVISYEAAVKHLLSTEWAVQTSLFFRDVYGQIGAREITRDGIANLTYDDEDSGHASGFELSLVRGRDERSHLALHYTWMQAWGSESSPEGDPYGILRGGRIAPTTTTPLSWDRRHSLAFTGAWAWRWRGSLAWSSTLGSPLPWTPRPRRQPLTDESQINSARLGWTECTNLELRWSPPRSHGVTLGLEVRNLFDGHAERRVSADGYPNRIVNALYDDYAAYRAETGNGGGAYWVEADDVTGHWVPVHDARLYQDPRTVRFTIGAGW